MKVFCPQHKRGFFTPRQSPIKCENRGHVLGDLDFHGEAQALVEIQWQYCCNCEHFCPIDFGGDGLERCPACTRKTSRFYLCDRCFTVTFESNTPLQTKNFTLTSEGVPQPSCPGCLQPNSGDVREHTCDELGASFSTALDSCPICRERLDVGPSFPCSVAEYLRRTKAANKLTVTFDYETGLFAAVEDGEFVLISNGHEANQSVILPRSERFSTTRDFYEIYQDYYHCSQVTAGEVHIIEPASAERSGEGWKLQASGILEVVDNQQNTKTPADMRPRETEIPVHEECGPAIRVIEEESLVTACTQCGSLVETRYAFCWTCGNSMAPGVETSEKATETVASRRLPIEDNEELTLQEDLGHVQSIFAWALPKEPSGSGSVLKLIGIAVVALLLLPLGLFVLTRSAAKPTFNTASEQATSSVQADQRVVPSVKVTGNAAIVPTQVRPETRPEEDELRKLREERVGATDSNRLTILQAFAKTENKFPNDYRFPYERAKLAINGSETTSHEEAFNALSLAAKTAIKTDRSQEMLQGLEADKLGDFHKLSHGHREWNIVIEALKSKDPNLLSVSAEF